MPRAKGVLAVRAVSTNVLHAGVVPLDVGAAVDTGNLVVGHGVGLRLVLEPLHGQQEQVPLILVLLQLADLLTSSLAIGGSLHVDPASTCQEHRSSFLEVGIHGRRRSMGGVHVSIVRKGNSDLEKDENGEQHAHEAVGFAEGGHVYQRRRDENEKGKREISKRSESNRN